MTRRWRPLSAIRLLSIAVLVAGIPAEGKAQSVPGAQWQVSEFADRGTPTALLVYGVPETDNALFLFLCAIGQSGPIRADIYVNTGVMAPNTQTVVAFSVDGTLETRSGTIVTERDFGPLARLSLERDDHLWDMLKAGSRGEVATRGGEWATFDLAGSHAAISDFLSRCAGDGHGGLGTEDRQRQYSGNH